MNYRAQFPVTWTSSCTTKSFHGFCLRTLSVGRFIAPVNFEYGAVVESLWQGTIQVLGDQSVPVSLGLQ